MRRRLPLLLGLPLLLVAASCAHHGTPAPGGATTTAPGTGDTTPATVPLPPSGAPVVELLDPGAEPRQPLRLQPAATCRQPTRQTFETAYQIGPVGQPPAVSDLQLQSDVTYRCTAVRSDSIAVRARVDAVKVLKADAGTETTNEQALDRLVGHDTRLRLDRQGAVQSVARDRAAFPSYLELLGGALSNDLELLMTSAQVPFPREAVGLGARWRVTVDQLEAGFRAHRVTEVTLTGVEGRRLTGTLRTTVTLAKGPVTVPGVPPSNGTVSVTDGTLTGTGTVSWDLRGVVPALDEVHDGTVHLSLDAAGQHQDLVQVQHVALTTAGR
jgi:hypothetical protein